MANLNEKPKTKKVPRFISYIFLLMGLAFVTIGGLATYDTYDFMRYAQATTGQVVSLDTTTNEGSTSYQPRFSYIATDGSKQEGETFLSSSAYNFNIGSKMDILYDSRDYNSVRLTGWFDTWGFGIIFLISGIVPLLIGLFLRKISKGKAKAAPDTSRRAVRHEVTPDDDDHSAGKSKQKRQRTVRR